MTSSFLIITTRHCDGVIRYATLMRAAAKNTRRFKVAQRVALDAVGIEARRHAILHIKHYTQYGNIRSLHINTK